MLNSFLIILYIFIMSKIKKLEIGYIEDILNKENIIDYKKINKLQCLLKKIYI